MKIIFLFFIFIQWQSVYADVSELELQELRYTKALVAFNNDQFDKALNFLGQNLNYKHIHLESIELAAQIHEKKKEYKKAIRSYYFLLKKENSKNFITLNNNDEFEEQLQKTEKPNQKQLGYFFKLGSLYLNYFDELQEKYTIDDNIDRMKKSKKERDIHVQLREAGKTKLVVVTKDEKREMLNAKILNLAEKYFKLCKHYDYATGLTTFQLGMTEKKRGNIFDSNKLFKQAYQMSFDLENDEGNDEAQKSVSLEDGEKSLKEVLEFYIGDSLYKAGHRELATKYLKSLSVTTDSPSLKTYSRLYIDSLQSSFLSFSALLGIGVDTNPYNQDPRTIVNQEYGETTHYNNREFAAYYNSDQKNNWAYTINGNFDEYTFFDTTFKSADVRSYSASAEIKKLKMPTSIWKFATTISNTHTKQDDSEAYSSFSTANEFKLAYDRYFKFGIASIAFPVTMGSISTTSGTSTYTESLASLSLTPWGISKYLQPSFSFSYGNTTTNGIFSASTNYRAYFSNQFTVSDKTNIFTTAGIKYDQAVDTTQTTTTFQFSLKWLYDLSHWMSNLILQTKYDATYIVVGESSQEYLRRNRISTNLQISF